MGWVSRLMDTNGDGTGSVQANVNGSVTPVVFKLAPRSGEYGLHIARILVHVVDSGSFDSGSYGNGITLDNGIEIGVYKESDDSLLIDLLDGLTIKTNVDWGRYCYDAVVSSYGQGNEQLGARWTFSKAGRPIKLSPHEYLAVTINDNLTGLVEHTFCCQGVSIDNA